jgi:hypothetical protein
VNAPEWLVPLPVLVEIAGEYGLMLEYAQNFHELIEAKKHDRGGGVQWRNYRGTISEPEWELARIYVALKFVKEGGQAVAGEAAGGGRKRRTGKRR